MNIMNRMFAYAPITVTVKLQCQACVICGCGCGWVGAGAGGWGWGCGVLVGGCGGGVLVGGCGGCGGGGVGFWLVCGCPACAGVHMCVSKREKLHSNGEESQECVGVIKHEEDQAQLWYEGEADVQGVFEMWPL